MRKYKDIIEYISRKIEEYYKTKNKMPASLFLGYLDYQELMSFVSKNPMYFAQSFDGELSFYGLNIKRVNKENYISVK